MEQKCTNMPWKQEIRRETLLPLNSKQNISEKSGRVVWKVHLSRKDCGRREVQGIDRNLIYSTLF